MLFPPQVQCWQSRGRWEAKQAHNSRVVQQDIELATGQLGDLLSARGDAPLIGHVELQTRESRPICQISQYCWIPSGRDNVEPWWPCSASATVHPHSIAQKLFSTRNRTVPVGPRHPFELRTNLVRGMPCKLRGQYRQESTYISALVDDRCQSVPSRLLTQ